MKRALPVPAQPAPDAEFTFADTQLFWRNLAKVGGAHVALVLALFLANWLQPKAKQTEVLWLDGGALGGGEPAAAVVEEVDEAEPEPELPVPAVEPIEPAAPAEIVEPKATPVPTTPKPATPKPATPKPIVKTTPKPKPKIAPASPKPATSPKPKLLASAKPSGPPAAKKAASESAGATTSTGAAKTASPGDGSGGSKTGSGGGGISQLGWYLQMIDDRFRSRWEQPVGIGADVITTVKLRILQDGTIASHEIVKSSGNPQMDESVMSAAALVKQIDPLPAGLGNGEHFDLNVNFKIGE